MATNEEGYRIFRNDALLATLAANTTSFEDDTHDSSWRLPYSRRRRGPSVKYGIQAFNGAGKSATKEESRRLRLAAARIQRPPPISLAGAFSC